MASGTSRNGGSQSPGATLTSNDAHEHVIDVNQEGTWKLNPISARTCIISSRASGSSAAVTSAVEMNRISLPALPISSPRPLLNNQNSPISSVQDLQEALLITDEIELPDSVLAYFTARDQLQDVTRGLVESVKAVLEGWTSTNCRDTLAASTAALEEMVNKVNAEQQNQSNMWKKQQFDGKSLDAELRRIVLRKDIYSALFTSTAALCGAGAFFAFEVHPFRVTMPVGVFVAVASVASLTVGYRIISHQEELKIPVEKRKETTKAISGACKFALNDLHDIEKLASTFKSQTESMLEMVDSGDMESDVVVLTGMEALKQGFQQLETKVDRCSKNAVSRSQALVDNILSKLD